MKQEMRDLLELVVERWKTCKKRPHEANQRSMDQVIQNVQDILNAEDLKDRVTTIVPDRGVGNARPTGIIDVLGEAYQDYESFQSLIDSLPKVKQDVVLWDEEFPFGVTVGEKFDLDDEEEDEKANEEMKAEWKRNRENK